MLPLSEIALVFGASFAAIMACMLALWLVSIPLRDVSIVDIFWGPGFAVVAWVSFALADGSPQRKWLVAILTTIWAARLGFYLLWRKFGEGEDPRYTRLIEHLAPRNRHVIGLTRVFGLQGVLMWVVAFPVMFAQTIREPASLGIAALAGAALWLVGFAFESIGDWQMARFKADPENSGEVMDRGLWRYTRHPNYFGDVCVWFGLFLIACDSPWGILTIVGPIMMTYFLLKVTGKALLERRMSRKKPNYAAYIARTSGFVPWFPKRG